MLLYLKHALTHSVILHLHCSLSNKEPDIVNSSTAHLNRAVPGSQSGVELLLQHQINSRTAEAVLTFISLAKKSSVSVSVGQFGADMQVSLINDGPVTFMLEL